VDETSKSSQRVSLSTGATSEQHETAVFHDVDPGEILRFAESKIPVSDPNLGADLGNFLSRPTLIKTFTWTEAGFGETSFDPWTLFFATAQIRSKIDNYAFFRGNLKVKVVINAAPFYYGALLMAYTPLNAWAPSIASVPNKYIPWSQRPHIWIYPQTSTGGELSLPFFYPRQYVDITSAADVATLGSIRMLQYTNLDSANGSSSNGCTLQIYAWVETPILIGPTVKLSLQGKMDEYGNGPVSAPATAMAKWADYAGKVPVIGRFAKATSIGASAVAKIATLFGWTNVPVIDNVAPMKNLPFHSLASAHLSEPTSKLTLDPKGELSVDPSIVGLDSEDELAIAHLVQKESYLTSSTWNTSDAVGTLLFTTRVNPAMGDRGTNSTAGTYTIATTPLSWLATMFNNWRGTIIVRIKVICSQYHQGRLRITWDPVGSLAGATDYTHVAMTHIIDLAESDEIEFPVPYMQTLPWSVTRDISAANIWSTTAYSTPTSGLDNGTLTVRVVTNLSAPVDTAPVSLLFFVRGAADLEFANPKDISNKYSPFVMQGKTTSYDENKYLVNWGEVVPSARLLMRRTAKYDTLSIGLRSITTSDKAGRLEVWQTKMPTPAGYDPTAGSSALGVENPASYFAFRYSSNTHMAWIGMAFLARRGGVRWTYNLEGTGGPVVTSFEVFRKPGSTISPSAPSLSGVYTQEAGSAVTSSSVPQGAVWNRNQTGGPGMTLTNVITQAGTSVEMPMMNPFIFELANPVYWTVGTANDGSDRDVYALVVQLHPNVASMPGLTLQRYVCAGVDFTYHFFLNSPMVYWNPAMGNVPG